jgi:hypothetical protein
MKAPHQAFSSARTAATATFHVTADHMVLAFKTFRSHGTVYNSAFCKLALTV